MYEATGVWAGGSCSPWVASRSSMPMVGIVTEPPGEGRG
jgi:hypothetical protein